MTPAICPNRYSLVDRDTITDACTGPQNYPDRVWQKQCPGDLAPRSHIASVKGDEQIAREVTSQTPSGGDPHQERSTNARAEENRSDHTSFPYPSPGPAVTLICQMQIDSDAFKQIHAAP
ncbi:hypothetical protein ACFOYW_08140 [Gryllotalpicola reticulitermitis]|uniref:Uncharacterized protein n=1 Tax=Gryllotalpicola reticulitermitis TaxID=1184153 RepID=A0ABV8Q4J2_9MICO